MYEKPVLLLWKVLKAPMGHPESIGREGSYKLLPLGEVELYPAVSKQQAEREFLRLLDS